MGNQNCKACLNKKYDIQSELINENVTDNSYRKENDNLNNINEQKYFDSNKNNFFFFLNKFFFLF